MADAVLDDVYPANGLHGIFAKIEAAGICDAPAGDLYDEGLSDFYDGFMAEYAADIPLFEEMAPSPDARVLDLASGAGRISTALARSGLTVDGLELSRSMLELAEANLADEPEPVRARVNYVQGDMTAFDLPGRYDLIILGITSISLLMDTDSRLGLFRCVEKHLADGGVFVFDTLDLEGENWRKFDRFHDFWTIRTEGEFDYGIVGQRFYPEQRRFIFNVYRESLDWDGNMRRVVGTSEKAWLTRAELHSELEQAGLAAAEERMLGDQRFFIVRRKGERS
jgi:SAM-dependent methyltransferase